MLVRAQRPLLLAGGGAWRAGAPLLALAERLAMPVVMTSSGKGIIAEDHALSLGDGWMAHQLGREALEQADVVLAVGVRFGPLTTSWWTRRIGDAIIHVDIDSSEIGKQVPAAVGIVGDATAVDGSDRRAGGSGHRRREASVAGRRRASRTAPRRDPRARARRRPNASKDCARCCRTRRSSSTTSTGSRAGARARSSAGRPRTFHYPIGFGCLGFAVPAAIGAKIARPDVPVVALSGDGGFLFTGQELATAVHQRVAVVVVVFNDQAFGTIKADQGYRYPSRVIGGDLRSPDFVRYAEAFGARGCRVDDLAQVPSAVEAALAHDGPTLIEAPCPQALPPWIETPSSQPGASRPKIV